MDLSLKSSSITSDNAHNKDSCSSNKTSDLTLEKLIDSRKQRFNCNYGQSSSPNDNRRTSVPIGVERMVIYDKAIKTSNSSISYTEVSDRSQSTSKTNSQIPVNLTDSLCSTKGLHNEEQLSSNSLVFKLKNKLELQMETKISNNSSIINIKNSDEGITKAKQLFHKNMNKYRMSLESEKNTYITGATLLAMKGLVSYEEYLHNNFKKNINKEILEKKFYLIHILGAIRGLTRLKLHYSKDRIPSTTMCHRMEEEDKELTANGLEFVSEVDDSEDESDISSTISSEHLTDETFCEPHEDFHPGDWKEETSETQSIHSTVEPFKYKPAPIKDQPKEELPAFEACVKSTNAQENVLPEELLQCGTCGIYIRSLQHLDRHLERCRGGTKRKSGSFPESSQSRRRISQQEGPQDAIEFIFSS